MRRFLRLYRYAKTSGLARKRTPLSLAWFWWRKGQDFANLGINNGLRMRDADRLC